MKLDGETQKSYAITYMWILEKKKKDTMLQSTSLQNRNYLTKFEKLMVTKGEVMVGRGMG